MESTTHQSKIKFWHLWTAFGVMAVAMITLSGIFAVNSYIPGVQFERFAELPAQYVHDLMIENGTGWIVVAHFIIDFVWAPLGVLILARWMKRKFNSSNALITVFAIIGCIALALDYTENICYLIWKSNGSFPSIAERVTELKMAAYGSFLIVYALEAFRVKIRPHMYGIKRFVFSSVFSLIALAVIFGLLTAMDQGSSLMIELMTQPWNVVGTFFLLIFLALALSHYPVYFEKRWFGVPAEPGDNVWRMVPGLRFLGFGLIYYQDKKDPKAPKWGSIARYHLGTATVLAYVYVVLFTANTVFPNMNLPVGVICILGGIAAHFYYRYLVKIRRDPAQKGKVRFLWVLCFAGLVIAIAGPAIAAATWGWCLSTALINATAGLLILPVFMMFRAFRFSLPWIKDNINYLKLIAVLGWLSMLILLLMNQFLDFTHKNVNGLVILVMYLVNYYGFIVIVTKHILFYQEERSDNPNNPWNRHANILPFAFIGFFLWSFYMAQRGNDLHTIKTVKETETVDLDAYLTRFQNGQTEPLYQLSAYGGGLKADVWTLLLFDEFDRRTNRTFFERTISMSGVSGGALGIANYAALYHKHGQDRETRMAESIDAVGRFNHLSIDLISVFGRDFVRELDPWREFDGEDRSYQAMKRYAEITYLGEFDSASFRSHWKEIYDGADGKFPAIAINTSARNGFQGVAFSIETNGEHNEIFPGGINILDNRIDDRMSLTYYGAASTTNRFPVFSPTARVEGLGHFIDGGAFDNSGVISTNGITDYLINKAIVDTSQVSLRHVIINNSKVDFVRRTFEKFLVEGLEEGEAGELSTLASSALSLDKVPNYAENADELETIYLMLPYRVEYQDVVSAFGGEPLANPRLIMDLIEENNEKISEALKKAEIASIYDTSWGVVEPPLGRLMCEPTIAYKKAMIQFHTDLQSGLMEIR